MVLPYGFQRYLLLLASIAAIAAANATAQSPARFCFVENRGQIIDDSGHARPDILFSARSRDVGVYLRRTGLSYVFVRTDHQAPRERDPRLPRALQGPDTSLRVATYRMDVDLVGASADARIERSGASAEFENFYLAHCPRGVTDVHGFERVIYHDIYPHIDLVYYSRNGGMKYDFIVHPGGHPSNIRLCYRGSSGLLLNGDGTVVARNLLGTVTEGRPLAYASAGSASTQGAVRARYRLQDSVITFDVGAYNHSMALVIDPAIQWSTYVGGSGDDFSWFYGWLDAGESGSCLKAGSNSSLSFTSISLSLDFPTTPGVFRQNRLQGTDYDVVLARFSSSGSRLWATYYGGTYLDVNFALVVDNLDNAYVAGRTISPDLPVTPGAFNPTHHALDEDGFLVKFDSAGHLVWSTFYNHGIIMSLGLDRNQALVLGGVASAPLAVTPGAFQTSPPAGADTVKGFLTKFTTGGQQIWCTYFDGTLGKQSWDNDGALGIAVDTAGRIYATGVAYSTNFPIVGNAFQHVYHGSGDFWIATFDTAGTPLWSTYFGGSDFDQSENIAVDRNGNCYVTGSTYSADYPTTASAFQPAVRPGVSPVDAVLASFDRNGNRRWATYIGGGDKDFGQNVDVDARGNLWVGFHTYSTNFPITAGANQLTLAGQADVAIMTFDTSGRRQWGSYYGGGRNDYIDGLVTTPAGVAVFGTTQSPDLPMAGTPFQATRNDPYDFFLVQLCGVLPKIDLGVQPTTFCAGDSILLAASPGYDRYRWSTGATTRSIVVRTTGRYAVTMDLGSCSATSDTVAVTVFDTPHRTLTPGGPIVLCDGDSITLRTTGGIRTYRWSTGDTTNWITVKKAGRYSLFFVDTNGCSNYSDTVQVTISPRPTTTITPPGPISLCDGASVRLDAGAGFSGYRWSTGDSSEFLTVTKSGTYAVAVRNADGCWGPLSRNVTVKVFPKSVVTIRNLLPATFCEGDSTILVATPGTFAGYLWSTGATTQSVIVRKDGVYTVVATDSNGCTATAQMAVSVKPGPHPTISASGPTRFCAGDSVILSSSGFSQYQWPTGATTPGIVVKDAGKYFVSVLNEGGCYGTSDTITVDVLPRPVITISGPISVCPNTFVIYNIPAVAGFGYLWSLESGGTISGGVTADAVSVLWGASGSGRLHARVTNPATGCVSDTVVTVTIGSSLKPVITASRSLKLCTGDSVTLDAGPYASYAWSTGASTRTITVGAAGRYAVSVADANGCSGLSDSVTVTTNTPPAPVIVPPNGGIFCAGDSIVLDAGAGYAKYLWSNGYTSQRITVRTSGTFTVTVIDAGGCTGTSPEVTVTATPERPPIINGPVQVCRNSTITYSTPVTGGSTYQWGVTGGLLASGQGTASIQVQWGGAGAGRIDLVETTSLGCTGASPGLEVSIGDHLVPTVTPSSPVVLCTGSTVHLDAGGGYASYQWSTGATTEAIDVTMPGLYTVTVADAGGCSGTSLPVEVIAKASPVPLITPDGPLSFCDGDSVVLRADAAYTRYLWSTGGTTKSIVVKRSGSYSVTVTDADGCTGASLPADVVVHPRPARPVIALNGGMLSTPASASSYQWLLDGVALPGATGQQQPATLSGSYQVLITNQFGCSAISDPFRYRTGAVTHTVLLDTVSARVGDRAHLVLRVLPPLAASDSVHGYHVEIGYDPRALFIHDVVSPDRTPGTDAATYSTSTAGLLTVDRPVTGRPLIGGELLRIELEGLISGQPLNVVTIGNALLPEAIGGVNAGGNGLVILSGCEIGMEISKRVFIEAIRPNPVHEELILQYRLPAGHAGVLRFYDGVGREIRHDNVGAGTGETQELRVDVAHISSGVYLLELQDGGEHSAVPVVIAK
ncbi:MAG TPA: SBBP repeat-containing protein [Candidatus Kapabacteria bacterium]|nr:SBBP repeat-containing protein [Candidatus Kapabacteria bacterium]